jgi:hypothetical protein
MNTMKTALLIIGVFSSVTTASAVGDQSAPPIANVQRSEEWNWGAPTNGIFGGASVFWPAGRTNFPIVTVGFVNTNITEGITDEDLIVVMQRIHEDTALYFEATNRFCGPVELRDSNGNLVPSKRPDLTSAGRYPEAFSLSQLRASLDRQSKHTYGSPLLVSRGSVGKFRLDEIFEVTEPDHYVFTAWPKLYVRPDLNTDTCRRLDIPPVTVHIRLTVLPSKPVRR